MSPPIPRPQSTEAWLAVGDSFADAMALRPGAPDFIIPVDSWTGLGQGLAIAPHVRAYNDQPTPHDANKLITFSLFMSGDERSGMDTVLQNWREIEHRLDMAGLAAAPHPRGTGVVFIQRLGDANDYVYFDVRTGVLASTDVNLPGTANWGAVVQLQCSQFGRQGRAITIDAASADTLTNGPGCFAFWQGVPGDAPALCEIQIRDVSPAGHGPIARLHLARRSYRRMAAGDFVPIDATSGVVTTSADWQQAAVAYFDAPGPHQGPLEDLWAMVQDDSPVVAVPGGGPAVTRSPGGSIPALALKYSISGVDAFGNEGSRSPLTPVGGGRGGSHVTIADFEVPGTGGLDLSVTDPGGLSLTDADTGTAGYVMSLSAAHSGGVATGQEKIALMSGGVTLPPTVPPAFIQWRARLDTFSPDTSTGAGVSAWAATLWNRLGGGLLGQGVAVYDRSAGTWRFGDMTGPAITLPFDGAWHTWKATVISVGIVGLVAYSICDISIDGVTLGTGLNWGLQGTPGAVGPAVNLGGSVWSGTTGTTTLHYAIDNLIVSEVDPTPIGTDCLTILNKDVLSWTALAGASSYFVYATDPSGNTYRFGAGGSITTPAYTVTDLRLGTFVFAGPAIGLPPVAPAKLRVGVGLGHQTVDLYHSRPVRTPQQNTTACMMRLATIPVPPTSRPDSEDGTSTPPFTIVVEARTGGQNASPLHIAGLWHMPAEAPAPDLIQITATAPGLTVKREWRIGTNRWGRSYCHLHDLVTGALVGSADVTGALNLGWGDSVLVILPEADDGAGGFKADLALTVKAGAVIIPRWRLGVAGEGGPP